MINALIVDDEKHSRETLEALMSKHAGELQVVGSAGSANEARQLISRHAPQLVFLDLEMPGESGFDLLASLPGFSFEVIFVTAHDSLAVTAFEFAAVGFLLKPVNVQKMKEAIVRAAEKIRAREGQSTEQITMLRQYMNNPNDPENRIAVPTLEGLEFIKIRDIVRCQASDSYTELHLCTGERLVVSKNLSKLEEVFHNCGFFRLSRSHMINLKYLRRYIKGSGGQVELLDGTVLDVPRRKREHFLAMVKSL